MMLKNLSKQKSSLLAFVTATYHGFARNSNIFLQTALFATSRKVANSSSYIFHSVKQSTLTGSSVLDQKAF